MQIPIYESLTEHNWTVWRASCATRCSRSGRGAGSGAPVVTLGTHHGPCVYVGILRCGDRRRRGRRTSPRQRWSAQGHLNPLAVLLAGTAGAALGDQFYFYLLRGRLRRWLDRYESIARRGLRLVRHVRRHESATVLLIRFAPGLRIALAAACAYAGVSPCGSAC